MVPLYHLSLACRSIPHCRAHKEGRNSLDKLSTWEMELFRRKPARIFTSIKNPRWNENIWSEGEKEICHVLWAREAHARAKIIQGQKKDRLFYGLGTSCKRSSHIPASERVNLKTWGLRFNLRENIWKIIYALCLFIHFWPNKCCVFQNTGPARHVQTSTFLMWTGLKMNAHARGRRELCDSSPSGCEGD